MPAWKNLRKSSICLIVFVALAVPLHAWYVAVRSQDEKPVEPAISPEQFNHAKTVFAEKCARCHGADGRGQTVLGGMLKAPNFTAAQFWTDEKNNKRLTSSITNGKKEMPAFGRKLSRQEINSLVVLVRHFHKPAAEKQNSEGEDKHP